MPNCIDARLLKSGLVILAALALGLTSRADAQSGLQASRSATGASPVVTISGRLDGRLGQILSLRPAGSPVTLADGRVEQRYSVSANVAFTLAVAGTEPDQSTDEIRVAESGTEAPISTYAGAPGYHAEIVVRSTSATLPSLVIAARGAGRAAVAHAP